MQTWLLIFVLIAVSALIRISEEMSFKSDFGENLWIIRLSDIRWTGIIASWFPLIFLAGSNKPDNMSGTEFLSFVLSIAVCFYFAGNVFYMRHIRREIRVEQAKRDLMAGFSNPRPPVEVSPPPKTIEPMKRAAPLPSSDAAGFAFDPDRFKKKSAPDLPDLTNWKISDEQ